MSVLTEFFKDVPATVRGITARITRGTEFLQKFAWSASQRMVTGRYAAGARTWRGAARASMEGDKIYAALRSELTGPVGRRVRELIASNAKLITSLPKDIADHLVSEIANRQQEGERAEINLPVLLRHVTRTRAALIARTETSKATSALTRARAEELNLGWYVWRTSEDSRVRLSHRRMDAVVVPWDSPPAPELLAGEKSNAGHYNAGEVWNCRCYAEPLLNLEQVRWPAKVYYGGSVRRMTLAAFRKVIGVQQPIAA